MKNVCQHCQYGYCSNCVDELLNALHAVNAWYQRDGSVGGCDLVMEDVEAILNKIPLPSTDSANH